MKTTAPLGTFGTLQIHPNPAVTEMGDLALARASVPHGHGCGPSFSCGSKDDFVTWKAAARIQEARSSV